MQTLLLVFTSLTEETRAWLARTDLTELALELGGALLLGIAVYWALSAASRSLARRLAAAAVKAGPGRNPVVETLGRMAGRTARLFIVIAALTAASLVLPLTAAQFALVHRIFDVSFIIQLAIWASAAFESWLQRLGGGTANFGALSNAHAIIGTIARVALWSIAAMLIFNNLGFDVTALITGLGIGGIAVGLALQKILGDLFASLAIVLDRPFEYGDFIVAGSQMGTIERIGLKTTRIRALSGEQIVISNADLLDSRIQNYKRMAQRRVVFSIGIVYGTPLEKIERIPQIIRQIVEAQDKTRFDRSHFMAYGDSSLNFETVYFVLSADYNAYMDIHQAILLAIYRRFAEEGIDFAFPTRTLHIGTMPPPAPGAGTKPDAPAAGSVSA
jgi:small-conductance mechanosensitive channel